MSPITVPLRGGGLASSALTPTLSLLPKARVIDVFGPWRAGHWRWGKGTEGMPSNYLINTDAKQENTP